MNAQMSLIGQKIKEERKAQKMTQTELANLSGASENFVSKLERAEATIQLNQALMVLETLGLCIELKYSKQ